VNDAVRPAGEQAVDARAIVACAAMSRGARNLLGIEPSGGLSLRETSAEVAELAARNDVRAARHAENRGGNRKSQGSAITTRAPATAVSPIDLGRADLDRAALAGRRDLRSQPHSLFAGLGFELEEASNRPPPLLDIRAWSGAAPEKARSPSSCPSTAGT
jgi:hypothetical protein